MWISASVVGHPGKMREKNEDNFCFKGKKLTSNVTAWPLKLIGNTIKPMLFGVFDGMGGIKAGERASYLAADVAVHASNIIDKKTDFCGFQIDICKRANAVVCDDMLNNVKQRMGTTASMLCFYDNCYYLCNIGDSPIFLFRDGTLKPIFHEHTEKENYLLVHGADAELPKKKFKLTQHIGIFPEEMEIEPYIVSDELRSGDRFIISSDGLTDMVEEKEISQVLDRKLSPSKTVKALLDMALENGGKDNITIICVDVK